MGITYNHRHLGIFSRPLVTIEDDCFYYKNSRYTHSDIKHVRVVGGDGQPQRMGVKLVDGRLLLVNAVALERDGVKAKTGFLSGTNSFFEELREFFQGPST